MEKQQKKVNLVSKIQKVLDFQQSQNGNGLLVVDKKQQTKKLLIASIQVATKQMKLLGMQKIFIVKMKKQKVLILLELRKRINQDYMTVQEMFGNGALI